MSRTGLVIVSVGFVLLSIVMHTTLQAYRVRALALFDAEARLGTRTAHLAWWYRALRVDASYASVAIGGQALQSAPDALDESAFRIAHVYVPRATINTATPLLGCALILGAWVALMCWRGYDIALRTAGMGRGDSGRRARTVAAVCMLLASVWLMPVPLVWAVSSIAPSSFPSTADRLVGPWPWAVFAPLLGWIVWIASWKTLRACKRRWRCWRADPHQLAVDPSVCSACGYERSGLAPGVRCPECGMLAGVAQPSNRSRKWLRRAAVIAGAATMGTALMLFVVPIAWMHIAYVSAVVHRVFQALLLPVLEAASTGQDVLWPETDSPVILEWANATAVVQTRRLPSAASTTSPSVAFVWAYCEGDTSDPARWTIKSGLAGMDKVPGSGCLEARFSADRVLWTTVCSAVPATNAGHLYGIPSKLEVDAQSSVLPASLRRSILSRLDMASDARKRPEKVSQH